MALGDAFQLMIEVDSEGVRKESGEDDYSHYFFLRWFGLLGFELVFIGMMAL